MADVLRKKREEEVLQTDTHTYNFIDVSLASSSGLMQLFSVKFFSLRVTLARNLFFFQMHREPYGSSVALKIRQ
jgi:hypothetical protein